MATRPIELTEKLVRYCQRLVSKSGAQWRDALAIACEAEEMLRRPVILRAEAEQLIGRFEAEAAEQGTAWHELCLVLKSWFQEEFDSGSRLT